MERQMAVLRLLADGRFRSGEELGTVLGVSRGAVWKTLQTLTALGLDVHAVRGKGYRLAAPLELLDADQIKQAMAGEPLRRIPHIEVLPEIDSTNRYLLSKALSGDAARACLAERQYAGRGRRGRPWVSPFAANLYLSLRWRFEARPSALEGVSLAVGIAVVRALREAGVAGLGLKWPNDVLWRGRKLAGVLLEMSGEAGGPVQLVMGVGVNLRMPDTAGADIDQPWVDVTEALGGRTFSRNRLAGRLLAHLAEVLGVFERAGLPALLEEWADYDVVRGEPVELHLADRVVSGIAQGVDATGALLLETGATVARYYSGEVSLRFPPKT